MRVLLRSILTGSLGEQSTQPTIRKIASPDPALFFEVAILVLEALPDSPERPKAYARLMDCQEFLKELIRIGRYSDQELQGLCATWIKIDGLLDVRLARLAPQRDGYESGLPPELVARLLDVLHHISSGPRLIILLNHLKNHPNPLVAEKATLLVGRRIQNLGWVKHQLASLDDDIRAAAVEGLWGRKMPSARLLLLQSRNDEKSQVVANALLGLYYLGEGEARQWVKEMACDERPSFRRCAVWAMGQIGEPEYLELLRAALADSEPEVRLAAKQALAVLRKLAPAAPRVMEPKATPMLERHPQTEAFRFRFDGSLSVKE